MLTSCIHSHELNEQDQHVPSLSVMHLPAFLLVFEVILINIMYFICSPDRK